MLSVDLYLEDVEYVDEDVVVEGCCVVVVSIPSSTSLLLLGLTSVVGFTGVGHLKWLSLNLSSRRFLSKK